MALTGRVALVTGAAGGIGLAIARRFIAAGARVVINDIAADAARAAAQGLDPQGTVCRAMVGDVGRAADAQALIEATLARFGRIDVLVNNAAIIHPATILDLTEADFERVLTTNLKGPFLLTQAAARAFIAQGGGGAVVNMSSVNAVLAIPNQLAYAVSKGGLNQLTRTCALALAPHRIRVNAIGPGSIATEMLNTVMTDPAARQAILSRTPLGRLGEVEEIAEIALFLASDAASYVTGQVLYADGGRLALNYTVPVPDTEE